MRHRNYTLQTRNAVGACCVAMRRLLRPAAAAVAAVGLALWFFGGPNTGRSEWFREVPSDRQGTVATERQFVFRPGLDFPGYALATAALLAWSGRGPARRDGD